MVEAMGEEFLSLATRLSILLVVLSTSDLTSVQCRLMGWAAVLRWWVSQYAPC